MACLDGRLFVARSFLSPRIGYVNFILFVVASYLTENGAHWPYHTFHIWLNLYGMSDNDKQEFFTASWRVDVK